MEAPSISLTRRLKKTPLALSPTKFLAFRENPKENRMTAYGHLPGEVIECLSIAVELRKKEVVDAYGNVSLRVGFRLGGGIDQDPQKAPFKYPDSGIYITSVEEGSPADEAGLKQHDKILQVNGADFTMMTHERAVKFVKQSNVLHILVARADLPPAPAPLCIPFTAVRDCVFDCPNMSDEWCGKGKILCDLGVSLFKCGQCVEPDLEASLCVDRKWQHLCDSENTVPCVKTSNCVFQEWILDGKDDCGDGSDEDPCKSKMLSCYNSTTRKPPTTPISTTRKPFVRKDKCEDNEFHCQSGECIEKERVLDGSLDCVDSSDEKYCKDHGLCPESRPCAFHEDIAAFGCGCPRGQTPDKRGICR
ncbi:unnamed protein product [Caenorhabditis auriculariae]|uniref:PDZ domain-containing protein n=1 Tax=Caenorhabditis auriculariae TaxID=2777116 RepID=A0A8S1H557_9PELO|nr:unnamed protein product [Caenorhabditis auriculariae]